MPEDLPVDHMTTPEGPGGDRVRPGSLAEAADAVRSASADDRPLLFRGAGTALTWGAPVTGPVRTVDTTGLDRIVGHAAEDWTVTAEAGMPLRALQRTLAESGQWLPLDPPAAAGGATLGGLLAAGDAGPLRLAFGGLADLAIGALVITGDGSVVRSGGNVIKNVAGYDLGKLYAGSLGAFGMVARLTLRVHPLPEAAATVAVDTADAGEALAAARALAGSPLAPAAAEWDGERLLVRFHGTAEGTAARVRRAAETAGSAAEVRELELEAAEAAWHRLDMLVRGEPGDTVLRAGSHPARLPALHAELRATARRVGVEADLTSAPASGVHTVRLRGGDAEAHAACLTTWRQAVQDAGGTVTLRRRRDGVDTLTAPWGAAPETAALLRALKQRFDPGGRCAPGRFAPWF